METSDAHRVVVRRPIDDYDADGSLRGELKNSIGAQLGDRHCSPCDTTHRAGPEISEWELHRAQ